MARRSTNDPIRIQQPTGCAKSGTGELSPLGRAAVNFAQRDWRICQGLPSGKVPLAATAPHGCHSATSDPALVEQWWRLHPDANILEIRVAPSCE
jgi:hypothetical protein